jgi:hypothetical protein
MKDRNSHGEGAETARVLRALAALVEKSSSEEIAALLKGQASLSRIQKAHTHRADPDAPPPDLLALAERLKSLNTREEGESLLASMSLARRDLEGLGKLLKVSILKTDNMNRLIDKIIEASIGSRLNSLAIRGENKDETA